MKKIWKFLSSMQFAMILLVILAIACTVSSFVTQGQTYSWYEAAYSERTAALIMALHLDDAYHSWWFITINAFLCINLLLCNVIRLPQLIARTKNEADPAKVSGADAAAAEGIKDPAPVFEKMRMPKPVGAQDGDGREILYSSKNRIGLWGAWVCHFGVLLLILGFSLGQMTKQTYTVYGVPGQTRMIGDTGLSLTIDDFKVDLREDDTVSQYTAKITVRDVEKAAATGDPGGQSAEISVNYPATLYGMKFYQNSTGWAARVQITEAGEPLQDEVLCSGEYLAVETMPDLVVYFNAFYPDYVMGPSGPMTQSGAVKNPAYLYTVYYKGQILGMNVLLGDEPLTIDDYVVTFTEPQSYTLIQIKKDSFTWLAFIGGMVTLAGLFLAFYLFPVKVWAVKDEDGTYTMYGQSRKGGAIFRDQFLAAAKDAGGQEKSPAPAQEDDKDSEGD
ncbi:MAG: cytochrome c biogenesis protein ResB [Lachnospiraceae bacterium]|nr:cytochrome c biogenesis protein ResB [Lachnospiraceae bacterium]